MKVHNYVLITLLSMGLIACHTPRKSNQSEKKEVAIQLYSARDLITHSGGGENIAPILTALGKMGYTSIEAADYCDGKFYGLTPERFKELVQAAGMTPISSHTTKSLTPQELETGDFTESLQWWDVAIEAHKAASMKYIVTPWLDTPATLHELQQYCHYYNEIGKRCRQAGLKYGYHNHAHELAQVEERVMLDYMLENTHPEEVFFQMDVYWMVMGQASPVEYFMKYPGRFSALHLKDAKELGQSGMVGFDAILRNLKQAGAQDLIVEVEHYNYDVEKSIEMSYNYLQDCFSKVQ